MRCEWEQYYFVHQMLPYKRKHMFLLGMDASRNNKQGVTAVGFYLFVLGVGD